MAPPPQQSSSSASHSQYVRLGLLIAGIVLASLAIVITVPSLDWKPDDPSSLGAAGAATSPLEDGPRSKLRIFGHVSVSAPQKVGDAAAVLDQRQQPHANAIADVIANADTEAAAVPSNDPTTESSVSAVREFVTDDVRSDIRGDVGVEAQQQDSPGAQVEDAEVSLKGRPTSDGRESKAAELTAGEHDKRESASTDKMASPLTSSLTTGEHDRRESVFTDIYRTNAWGSRESRSGWGSEVGFTATIRQFMGLGLKMYNVTSLLDSPCGDCNWQPLIPGFNSTQYTGVDIVKDVIEADKAKYQSRPNMRFFQVDLAEQSIPQGSYDAVLCRDMIQHLPIQAGLDTYRTLEATGAKYLFTSFHSETKANSETNPGGFKYFDPMLPPFNFPAPIMYAMEGSDNLIRTKGGRENFKMIGLWRLPALGKGTGKSITPINTAALSGGTFIVADKVAARMMREMGMTNFQCHTPDSC